MCFDELSDYLPQMWILHIVNSIAIIVDLTKQISKFMIDVYYQAICLIVLKELTLKKGIFF